MVKKSEMNIEVRKGEEKIKAAQGNDDLKQSASIENQLKWSIQTTGLQA